MPPKGRHISTDRQLDTNRVVHALFFVILLKFAAQSMGLATDNTVLVSRVFLTASKHFRANEVLMQQLSLASYLICAYETEESLQPFRSLKECALQDSIQFLADFVSGRRNVTVFRLRGLAHRR
jgi:hypothetical protein